MKNNNEFLIVTFLVFGVSLTKVLNMEKREIPLVCELTINNLRARALDKDTPNTRKVTIKNSL